MLQVKLMVYNSQKYIFTKKLQLELDR